MGTDHTNGGAVLAPLQVYCTGMGAPSATAGLLIVKGPPAGASAMVRATVVTVGVNGAVTRLPPWPPQPTSATTSASPPVPDAIRRNVHASVEFIKDSVAREPAVWELPSVPSSQPQRKHSHGGDA